MLQQLSTCTRFPYGVSRVAIAEHDTRLLKLPLSWAAVVLEPAILLLSPPRLLRGRNNPVGVLGIHRCAGSAGETASPSATPSPPVPAFPSTPRHIWPSVFFFETGQWGNVASQAVETTAAGTNNNAAGAKQRSTTAVEKQRRDRNGIFRLLLA